MLAIYAGYSFAKYRYFGRKPVMLFMLSAQMFPFGLLLITHLPDVHRPRPARHRGWASC